MQDVASRVDQSCSSCESGWCRNTQPRSTASIWLETENRLQRLSECPEPGCPWCINACRTILDLMWHYAQSYYFEAECKTGYELPPPEETE